MRFNNLLSKFLLLSVPLFGASSVRFTATKSGKLLNYGGFTNVQSIRGEGRIHGRPAPSSVDAYAFQFANTQNSLKIMSTGGSLNDRIWCLAQLATQISGSPSPTDFEFRWQRNAGGTRTCDVWNMTAPGAPLFYSRTDTVTPSAIATGDIIIGGSGIQFDMAYFRIFVNDPVPAGSTAPGASSVPGNYASYNFEGTTPTELGLDTSGNNRHLTWVGGDPTTVTTPVIAPDCDAGATDSFRAGDRLIGDGSASVGFNGFPLSYQWVVTEKPASDTLVNFKSMNVASSIMSLNNAVAGQYTLKLTVSDTLATTDCTVTHGVVPYTDKGLVIVDTSTAEKAKFHQLLKPVVAMPYLKSVWPYAAYILTKMDEHFRGLQAAKNDHFWQFWEDPTEREAGTISVSGTSVTGTGTTLKTTFCGGNPYRNAFGVGLPNYIFIRYPSTNPGGFNWAYNILPPNVPLADPPILPNINHPIGYYYYNTTDNKQYKNVANVWTEVTVGSGGCTDETHMELWTTFNPADGVPPYNNMVFFQDNSAWGRGGGWSGTSGGSSSTNFYDVAKAGYAYHFATGLTAPLERARHVAEGWAKSPYTGFLGVNSSRESRDMALTGMGMRYLEDTSQTWLLTALRGFWGRMKAISNAQWSGERESFYVQKFIAECALIDTTTCTTAYASEQFDKWFQTSQCTGLPGQRDCGGNNHGHIGNAGRVVYAGDGSWIGNYVGKTVNAVEGSRIVTLNGGGTHTWPTTYWNYNAVGRKALWIKTDGMPGGGTNNPAYGWQNTQVSGTLGSIRYLSPTTVELPEPWPFDDCNNCPWIYTDMIGIYAVQPYMLAIAGQAAYETNATTGNTNAADMMTDFGDWLLTYGYNVNNGGAYYFREAINTETFSNGDPLWGDYGIQTSRFLNPELLGLIPHVWLKDQNPAMRTFGDTLMGKMFSSTTHPCAATTCGPYTDAFEQGNTTYPLGDTFTGNVAKNYGILAGVGGALVWPAVRDLTEWPRTPATQVHKVHFNMADIAGANGAIVRLRNQFGVVSGTTFDCSSPPCNVTVPDGEAGNYMYEIEFRKDGVPLVPSGWMSLTN